MLTSEEILIKRLNGEWQQYEKSDTSKITSDNGDISPALDSTYTDISKLTVKVYPDEKPIVIKGLAIEMVGDIDNAYPFDKPRGDEGKQRCYFVGV